MGSKYSRIICEKIGSAVAAMSFDLDPFFLAPGAGIT
jgi:hypothetical protein